MERMNDIILGKFLSKQDEEKTERHSAKYAKLKKETERVSKVNQSGSQSGLKNQLSLNLMMHFLSPFQASSSS